MGSFLGKIGSSFAGMWRESDGLNLKSIRPAMLAYSLAYMFELVFYAWHDPSMIIDVKLFGIGSSMLMYIGHMLMSLIIMLLWSKKFKPLIHLSLAMTVPGFLAYLFMPVGVPKLLCAVLAMAGLGGCVTSARCGFAFAANNAERVLGVVLALGVRVFFVFMDVIFPAGLFWHNAIFTYICPIVCLAGLTICLLCFKESDLEYKENSTPQDRKGLYWAMAIFIAYFAIAGYTRFLGSADYSSASLMDGIGGLIAIVLFVSLLLLLKKNIWHIWNLYLVITIIAAALVILPYRPSIDTAVHILKGTSRIGWIAVLYLLACAQRRFASLKLLKQCTIVFVIVSPLTTLSDELLEMIFPGDMALVSLIYVLAITVAFLMASPYLYKYLFSAEWVDDLQKQDMALWYDKIEEADRFENYGLTPREKEVAALLLGANTVRMIAGELKLSQSTVNMHTSNLYRKLGINSKAELFKKFGVAEESEVES